MIFKILKYFIFLAVFTSAFIILTNNYKINNDTDLTEVQILLKHNIVDHKFNNNKFDYHSINIRQNKFTEKSSGVNLNNSFQEFNKYIRFTSFFFNNPHKKIFYSVRHQLEQGYSSAPFQPPKYLA